MKTSLWDKALQRRIARRRALAIAGGSVMGAAIIASCGGDNGVTKVGGDKTGLVTAAEDSSKKARRGGVLKWWLRSDPPHLDAAQAVEVAETIRGLGVQQLLYEKPGYLSPTDLEPAGDLAESWEWSGDLLQLTLKLRQGVKWHNKPPINGRTLDVDDVVFSWDRLTRVGGARAAWANAVNPDAPILSIAAPDSRTIVLKLKQPLAYLLSMLSYTVGGNFLIVPKETDSTFDIRRDMIGTGPYVLTNYTPSVSFTAKRNIEFYEKDTPYIDEIEIPIVPEYATGIAQFRAGAIHTYDVRPEDVLQLRQDVPKINLYQTAFAQRNLHRTNFGSLPGSPFHDERIRQAYSMSLDRDLWIDVVHNVEKFRSEGLPVDTRWHSCFVSPAKTWALDPRSREFGPNVKYFEHNVGEAKKLLAAAGYPSGLDVLSTVPEGTSYGINYLKHVEIVESMVAEAGFRTKPNHINYAAEYIPNFRDAKGRFEGWIHKVGGGVAWDAVAILVNDLHSKRGQNFYGFDAAGKGDQSGDPQVESLLDKASAEVDAEKRRSIAFEIQRYMGNKLYNVVWPGEATGFSMAWQAIRNFEVFQGGTGRRIYHYWWIDDTLPPVKKV